MTIPVPPDPSPGVPAQTLAEWRAAEDRLYPVVMVRPDIYQRSVELVRGVADELSRCTDPAALAAAWGEAAEIVYRVSNERLLPLGELDAGLVAGAAFALRYRELVWPSNRDERVDRVRAAADRGESWVLVEQLGSLETAAVMPCARLEMHLGTGTGLRLTVDADPETSAPRYGIEVVRLDPETGERLGGAEDPGVEESFSDRAEWMEAIAAKRGEIDGG